MTWASPLWTVVMTLMLGFGASIIGHVLWRYYERPRVPAEVQHAREELGLRIERVIRSNMELMENVRDLVELIKVLPPEYLPVAEQALRYAQILEQSVFDEGANRGVFPRHHFGYPGAIPASTGYVAQAEDPVVDVHEVDADEELASMRSSLSGDLLMWTLRERG